MLQRRQYIHRV